MKVLIQEAALKEASNGNPYMEVVGLNTYDNKPMKKTVFDHEDKWPLLVANTIVEFVNQRDGTTPEGKPKWKLVDIKKPGTPPPVKPTLPYTPDMDDVKAEVKPTAYAGRSPTPASRYKADPDKTDSIERQVALKCAVELVVAGKIEPEKVLSYSETVYRWLKGDIQVKDEAVFKEIITSHFKTEGV